MNKKKYLFYAFTITWNKKRTSIVHLGGGHTLLSSGHRPGPRATGNNKVALRMRRDPKFFFSIFYEFSINSY